MQQKPMTRLAWIALIITIFTGFHLFFSSFTASDPGVAEDWSATSAAISGFFAICAAVLAWNAANKNNALPWALLTTGIGLWVSAQFFVVNNIPSSLFFVAGYLPLIVAVPVYLTKEKIHISRMRLRLAALIGLSLLSLVAVLFVRPILDLLLMGLRVKVGVDLLLPLLNVVIVVGGILVMGSPTRQDKKGNLPWALIAFGMILFGLAGIWQSILSTAGGYGANTVRELAVDLPHMLAYTFVCAGCLQFVFQKETASRRMPVLSRSCSKQDHNPILGD